MFATTLATYFFLGVDFFFAVFVFAVEDFFCAAAALAPSCDSVDFTLPKALAAPAFGAFRPAEAAACRVSFVRTDFEFTASKISRRYPASFAA
jgi:hypothetical protein